MYRSTLVTLLSPLLTQLVDASLYGESYLNHTCELKTPHWSCSALAHPNVTDSCCTETYGGLVLSTQFWDTYTGYESSGQLLPKDSWTLHGLWPDYCNGSYTQYCDLNRQFDPSPSPNTTTGTSSGTPVPPYKGPPITKYIEEAGKYDLLAYMNKYWINQGAPNWYLWAHEFSKHATCFSTFDTPCFGSSSPNSTSPTSLSTLLTFLPTALSYYLSLPTHTFLATHSIHPSNTSTYTLSSLQHALTTEFGALPYIGCSGPRYNNTAAGKAANSTDTGYTVVSEVWYYYYVLGRVQDAATGGITGFGRKKPVGADVNGGSVSSCAKAEGALRYLERSVGSVRAEKGKGGYGLQESLKF
ncbi:ribonuclease t2 family protein [Rutstroemia sp. NJR-2017a WRK4]|nr:ribonuclease t2 family protein [Rutstroemia sp. NJR-2017a WRK4]